MPKKILIITGIGINNSRVGFSWMKTMFRLRHNWLYPGHGALVAGHAGGPGVGRDRHCTLLGGHRGSLLLCQGECRGKSSRKHLGVAVTPLEIRTLCIHARALAFAEQPG